MSDQRRIGKRIPLADANNRANAMSPPSRLLAKMAGHKPVGTTPQVPAVSIPKNESLVGDGTLDVRHSIQSPPLRPKRISEVTDEDAGSKRNSAASSSSTGTARKRKTHVGPWHLGRTIGKGGTSRVRQVRHAITQETAVAKIIAKSVAEKARTLSLANLTREAESGDPGLMGSKVIPFGLEREIVIMKLLNHPNIVRLFDVWENHNELYLIMEHVEGCELFEYVAQRQRVSERDTVYMFRQIIAALLYCHRLKIHHRDLKPENILLNPQTLAIKVVDFGYAALQPHGGRLTTPCGSPHYAAPEVIQGKPYDGSKSDIWSCGVILFVLLTGVPPFNFPPDPNGKCPEEKKLKGLFAQIVACNYKMPSFLSAEAQDLIRKIFVVNPAKRIGLDDLWHHPLLHKFDRELGHDATSTSIEYWIGPYPKIDNWRPVTKRTIDPEILRNLRTLWHSVEEKYLIEQICNAVPNQEKYFYNALLKYREEMDDTAGMVAYSASDHRHSKPVTAEPTRSLSRASHREKRSTSRFSVAGNEHLYSRHSFFDKPSSEASYDPFRASRDPVYNTKVPVSVHRQQSDGSQKLRLPDPIRSHRPTSNRVEILRRASRRSSGLSSASANFSIQGSLRSNASRSSVRSGLNGAHSLSNRRPSSVHKRNVNFSHLRRGSSAASKTPDRRQHAMIVSSPPRSPTDLHITKNNSKGRVEPTPRTKRLEDTIDQEARKVSAELQNYCDELFYHDSLSSSNRTSLTDKPNPYSDTPPSSVSNGSNQRGKSQDTNAFANRPLPPTPAAGVRTLDTPHGYTTRELVDLRERLARRYASDGANSQEEFTEVLRHLDHLVAVESQLHVEAQRRAVSAPYANARGSGDTGKFLHVIPEEGRFADAEEFPTRAGASRVQENAEFGQTSSKQPHQPRAVTDPINTTQHRQLRMVEDRSIRVVPPSSPPSPSPWPPLNIRKHSDGSAGSGGAMHSPTSFTPNVKMMDSNELLLGKSTGKTSRFSDLDDRTARRDRDYLEHPEKFQVSDQIREEAVRRGTYRSGDPNIDVNGGTATPPTKTATAQGLRQRLFKPFQSSKLRNVISGNAAKHDQITPDDSVVNEQASSISASTTKSQKAEVRKLGKTFPGSDARPLLARLFNFKPKQMYLPIKVNNYRAAVEIHDIIRSQSTSKNIRVLMDREKTEPTYELSVEADADWLPGPTKFAIEFFAIVDDDYKAKDQKFDITVLRFTHLTGSANAMAFLVERLDSVIRIERWHWVVDNPKEAKAYKAAFKKRGPSLGFADATRPLRRMQAKSSLRG